MKSLSWIAWILIAACGWAHADEPAAENGNPVIAMVGDQKITADQRDDLPGLVLGNLLETYAAGRKITASDEEVALYVNFLVEGEARMLEDYKKQRDHLKAALDDPTTDEATKAKSRSELESINSILKSFEENANPSPEDRLEITKFRREMAKSMIVAWKVNQALFEQYGGRVIFQQTGPEPLDAYQAFLRERLESGAFKFLDPSSEPAFWSFFTDNERHSFYPEGEGAKALGTPPWKSKPAD